VNPSTTTPRALDTDPGPAVSTPAPTAPSPAPAPAPDPSGAELSERIGFEIELLAPAGSSREVLAQELARRHGGGVRRFFHTDSEPSLVPGITSFLHLTHGFAVSDADGAPLCHLVDDITIRQDLDPRTPALPGWFRIVSDEPRLLRLVERHADPDVPLTTVLDPVARLFGVTPQTHEHMVKVEDAEGAPIALAAPLPGERHRPCEVITPPIAGDHRSRLDQLLSVARELGFTVPAEAAVHLHLDAAPLRQVTTLANLVRLFSAWREPLRDALATNPRCRRLAPLPAALVELVADPPSAEWSEMARAAAGTGVTKYADVNLTRLVTAPRAEKDTVEIRCLPGSIDTEAIVAQAALVERLVHRCRDPRPLPEPRPGDRVELLLGS
jgi:hypothetical protein